MSTAGITQTPVNLQQSYIALVGHPNVGKSVIFQKLTGQFVTVSNYPGTTLEIARGVARRFDGTVILDTPGVLAFPPQSEDERVTEQLLLNEPLDGIIQVGDAKNLRRTLLLTVQLIEMGLPLVLALNMMDEAQVRGVVTDEKILSQLLHIPIIPTTAIRGLGVHDLLKTIKETSVPDFRIDYSPEIESSIEEICKLFESSIKDIPAIKLISHRALALLWLSEDVVTEHWVTEHLETNVIESLESIRSQLCSILEEPALILIQQKRIEYVNQIINLAVVKPGTFHEGISAKIGRLAIHPIWGTLILVIVLIALYLFVGVIGAGVFVDFFEGKLFGGLINPWIITQIERLSLPPLFTRMLVGDFGLWTMGITYALALILPLVTTFFIAFSVLEDSGYLPRLAALSNRFFQALGLNGKAVLPMVLGLGCITMATLTTRILESKRDRLLVTLLLALAIPCSAQLGIILGMLAGLSVVATLIWGVVVLLIMLIVGWLASKLIPGERSLLLVELPPLRMPSLNNVVTKTLARLEWYLREVIPLFLLGAFIMFALSESGVLDWLIKVSQPLVTVWLGLPAEAGAAFLMGFMRRDFGATGLFVMETQGMLSPAQVVVAMVTITLFIPCLASVIMIARERGWRTAMGAILLTFPLAFLVGGLLSRALILFNWGLQ